jgi:hypothetical protein
VDTVNRGRVLMCDVVYTQKQHGVMLFIKHICMNVSGSFKQRDSETNTIIS